MSKSPFKHWNSSSLNFKLKYSYKYIVNFGELTLAGCQVSTKVTLSFFLISWTGEKNIIKGSWAKIRAGRDHSPITMMDKTDSTWLNQFSLLTIKSESDNEK